LLNVSVLRVHIVLFDSDYVQMYRNKKAPLLVTRE